MRSLLILGLLVVPALNSAGQFEIGLSAGPYVNSLWERPSKSSDPHSSATFESYDRPSWTAMAHYRETGNTHLSLGLTAGWVRREFRASYSQGGMASVSGKEVDVQLDLLYLGIVPELPLSANRKFVMRFGLEGGFLLGGHMQGEKWSTSGTNTVRSPYEGAARPDFGGDVRIVAGAGFRSPIVGRLQLVVDPYVNLAVTSLLKQDPGNRGMDFGVRIGLALSFNSPSLTMALRRDSEDRRQGN